MKIPITNNGLIKNYLATTGGEFLLSILQNKAKQAEERLIKDSIPEQKKIGVQCAYVLPLNYAIISFSIERTHTGWVLLSWGSTTTQQEDIQSQQIQI